MGIECRFGTRVLVGRCICGVGDRPDGELMTGAKPDIAEILEVSLVMRSGEASTDTRLACGAQQCELWTFVSVRLRTVN